MRGSVGATRGSTAHRSDGDGPLDPLGAGGGPINTGGVRAGGGAGAGTAGGTGATGADGDGVGVGRPGAGDGPMSTEGVRAGGGVVGRSALPGTTPPGVPT
jgi:hypothetical protein